ncbi:MAG: glycosyltransferase family 2 protein, partial [Candidatus Woesearchaeota archaeon]
GCDFAVKTGAQQIIVLDSDGQHDPAEIPRFIKALAHSDIVLGYRRLNWRMPLVFRFGNWFINKAQGILFQTRIRDTQCGFRAFTTQAYKKIRWNATDYSMESEMVANIGKAKLKYVELPIKTIYSDKYKGTTIIDGICIVMNMLLWRLKWRG